MNKEELIKEFDKRQKALRDEFISKLEGDKFKLTYPENEETVYFIRRGTQIIYDTRFWSNSFIDKSMFEMGEYFKTKKEAEQYLKECKLLFKIKKWAEIKNDGWEQDWDISKCNYYLLYDSEDKKLTTTYGSRYKEFSKLPCFRTVQLARECIDTFGDEIIEVLVNA